MKRKCFVIAPINKEGSHERRKINDLIETIFKPILSDFEVEISHQISTIGLITSLVVKKIHDSDLVIADITNTNGNVMYELGVADTLQKPVVIICENTTEIPFDKKNQKTIMYDYYPYGMVHLQTELLKITNIISSSSEFIDNTVSQAIGFEYLTKNINLKNIAQDAISTSRIRTTEKEKIINTIDNSIMEIKSFEREKYLESVYSLLDKKVDFFKEKIKEREKNKKIGLITFDYVIKTENRTLYIKIMKTLARGEWSREAKDINMIKSGYPELIRAESKIIFIVPMVRLAGKQTNGISLLKFDSKINEINNYDAVLNDLNN